MADKREERQETESEEQESASGVDLASTAKAAAVGGAVGAAAGAAFEAGREMLSQRDGGKPEEDEDA
jgi:hypothetical protein